MQMKKILACEEIKSCRLSGKERRFPSPTKAWVRIFSWVEDLSLLVWGRELKALAPSGSRLISIYPVTAEPHWPFGGSFVGYISSPALPRLGWLPVLCSE